MCYHPYSMMLGFCPQDNPESPFYTLAPHTYDDGVVDVTVPANFWTDFTSGIKFLGQALLVLGPIFWYVGYLWVLYVVAVVAILIRDPLGRHQRASVFHDYCYRNQEVVDNCRFTADAIYRVMLTHDGVGVVRRNAHYYGLRMFGWYAWNKNARKANR
jgi:hypothetical protein